MDFVLFILVALLVEFVLERIKAFWPGLTEIDAKYKKVSIYLLLGFIVAIPLSLLLQADFFRMLGQEVSTPYVGVLLTALFASGGSKVAHDIIDRITKDVIDGDLLIDTSGMKDIYRLDLSTGLEDLKKKNKVVLKVFPNVNLSSHQ